MYKKIKKIIKKTETKLFGKKTETQMISTEKSGRRRSVAFARSLLEYDVVSFDIFDTLVFRTLDKPTDIFMVVGQKLGVLNYVTMRREMERMLRNQREAKDGSTEVTFQEIYQAMEEYCGIDADIGMKTEFETELEFCIANPYMKEVFDLLINYGKTVIIVSDMYFPKEMMEKVLSHCGYKGYSQLFVSCDYGCGKRSGKLYQIIREKYLRERSIIHVGDNEEVDVVMATQQRWNSAFYQDIRTRGEKFRPKLMSPYIGSAYRAMINIKMHSGAYDSEKELALPYQYGYINGGILILGYVTWIHEQAVREGIDKVLFIARDGWIMKQVYDSLYTDIPSEYIYLSRNAALKFTYDYNKYELLKQFIHRREGAEKPYTVEEILQSMELSGLIVKLSEIQIQKEEKIDSKEKASLLESFVLRHWEEVSKVYEDSQRAFRKYMEPMLKDCRHVAVIDTGWRGTCPMALKYVIEKKWKKDCKVTGMIMGSCKYKQNNTIPFLANESIRTYLFSPEHNDHLARYHYKNNLIHNTSLEFITTAPHPSVCSFQLTEEGYAIEFEHPEIENYDTTRQIHEGIMDFVQDYKSYYGTMDVFWRIPGMDAYLPIRYVMEKRFDSVVKKTFKNYVYNKYVGGLEGRRDMMTFSEMCKEEM